LNPNDPYHEYYQYAVQEAKKGKLKEDALAPKVQVKEKKPLPPKPAPFEFLPDLPSITTQDLYFI
jgi:hypothetical protein